MASTPEVKPALLFIPDISGFTKFVNDTEILHSQHIIQELLEILIDSNQLNMQVNGVEGDAILFFKPGNKPKVNQLTSQVEKMYVDFHQHLKLYDHQRICHCGACKSAIDLKLKIIMHYGEVAEFFLKDRKQLHGKDVIVVHRLLKNDVNHDEYVLITDPLVTDESAAYPSWFSKNEMTGNYDSGEIRYVYSVLTDLQQHVPPPKIPQLRLSEKTIVSFVVEGIINAPMEKVFDALFDLEKRKLWGDGIRDIELLNHDKINRVGAEHRCIVKAKNNPIIVTESANVEENRIVLVEMDKKGMGGARYLLERKGVEQTVVRIEMLVNRNPVVKLMFNLMMKSKYRLSYQKSIVNLEAYCRTPAGKRKEAGVMA
jgi:hypothetical protein